MKKYIEQNFKVRAFCLVNEMTEEKMVYFKPLEKYDNMIGFELPNDVYHIDEYLSDVMIQWEVSYGVKVFEGDLVKAICSVAGIMERKARRICKVYRSGRGVSLAVWHKKTKTWNAYRTMDFTSIEVIGNIYENKDLL